MNSQEDAHRNAYLEEARDLLTDLEASLLELEKSPDDSDLLHKIFRALHTIKGSGAMDYATLTDNNGRKADFGHVVLLMTTNAGAREMAAKSIGFAAGKAEDTSDKGKKAVQRLFSPEFRNRLDAVITFKSLTPKVMHSADPGF